MYEKVELIGVEVLFCWSFSNKDSEKVGILKTLLMSYLEMNQFCGLYQDFIIADGTCCTNIYNLTLIYFLLIYCLGITAPVGILLKYEEEDNVIFEAYKRICLKMKNTVPVYQVKVQISRTYLKGYKYSIGILRIIFMKDN